jgi:heme/copper-type cytochrome/quinol oxidase subunit 2
MRIAVLWCVLAISVGLFVGMLVALRRYHAHNGELTHRTAAVEYGWAIVPWLIVALGAAPAVQRILLGR